MTEIEIGWVIAALTLFVLVGIWVLDAGNPLKPLVEADEAEDRVGREFTAYVARELRKAEAGAANAAPWARELLAEWKKRRNRG